MSAGAYKVPAYRIAVEGRDITPTLAGRLIDLTLTDNRGFEVDQLDIVLDDHDGALDLPPRGAEITLAIGWQDEGLADKGRYIVDEITHEGTPDRLTIRARSADLRAGLTTQRERSWHQASVQTIIDTIADENDLIPVIAAGLSGQIVDHIDQTNESSANLLTRLAGWFDAIATVKDGRLLFMPAAAATSASGKAMGTTRITRTAGDRHHFSLADRQAYTYVKALWNDTGAGTRGEILWGQEDDDAENNRQRQEAAPATGDYKPVAKVSKSRAAAKRLAKKEWQRIAKNASLRERYVGVSAPYNDRNLNVSGTVLYGAEDERRARQHAARLAAQDAEKLDAPAVAIGDGADNVKVLRHVYASQTTAKRAARAEWRRIRRGMAEFSLTLAYGRAELIPDMPAAVSGFKPAIDNTDWIIVKVTHTLDDNGYTTRLDLEIKATEIPG